MPRPKRKTDDSRKNASHVVAQKPAGVKTDGVVNLISEPGALSIDAAAEAEETAEGKPVLPRFSMVAYTGGVMRVGGWRYPHPRSSYVILSQAMEHAWQLVQADRFLGPQEHHLDAIERVLRQRLHVWQKTGRCLNGLGGWEIAKIGE